MKKILTFIIIGLGFAAASCTKADVSESKGEGMLSVDMSIASQTRAAVGEDELLNTAVVNIYKADFSGLVRSYTYSDIPSPMYLAADKYRVDVLAGEAVAATPEGASWDSKSYKGSQTFEIVAGQVTTVQVVANVNNAVTKASFDPTVAENFNEGYTLTMTLSDEAASTLVYDASKSGAEGYYIVAGLFEPSLTWTFTGTLAKDGSSFTKTGVIENVEPGKLYNMNLKYTIKDGDLVFSLSVDRSTEIVDDTIIFEPVSTGLAPSSVYEIWATRATIHADVDASEGEGKTIKFAYSTDEGSTWTYVDAVNDSEGTYKAELTGLAPQTKYTYALCIDDVQIGEPMTFTTEAAPNFPNASFEYVSKVTGNNYYKFYDPNCGVEEGMKMFWGSGNGEGPDGVNGSANMNIVITDVDTSTKIDGNQSVVAQTSSMVGMLAAGNLFAGQFVGLVGTSGGIVNFGRPWTSRPTAMRIWCKYETGLINILNNNNLGVTKNDYDRAQVKVAIGTWDYKKYGGSKESPVQINTTDESTFVDYYTDPSTIANGDVIIYKEGYSINKGELITADTTGWIEYVIPLEYHNLNAYPTHIVVSCAASQFGDYFTGYDKTKLWIDAVELIYE
jgi:hypothetical protein